MDERKITCIVCPKGCNLSVIKENGEYIVSGNLCKRGRNYGINEVVNPTRMVTSTVKIKSTIHRRLPVITEKEIPKELIFDVMKEINQVCVNSPVKIGDIILENVLNTGVNIIASRTIKE